MTSECRDGTNISQTHTKCRYACVVLLYALMSVTLLKDSQLPVSVILRNKEAHRKKRA